MKYMLEQDTDNSGTLDFEEFKVHGRDAYINILILLILYYVTLYWALLTTAEYAVHRGVHKMRVSFFNLLQVAIKIAQKKLKDLSNHD